MVRRCLARDASKALSIGVSEVFLVIRRGFVGQLNTAESIDLILIFMVDRYFSYFLYLFSK